MNWSLQNSKLSLHPAPLTASWQSIGSNRMTRGSRCSNSSAAFPHSDLPASLSFMSSMLTNTSGRCLLALVTLAPVTRAQVTGAEVTVGHAGNRFYDKASLNTDALSGEFRCSTNRRRRKSGYLPHPYPIDGDGRFAVNHHHQRRVPWS